MTAAYFLCVNVRDRLILGAQMLDPRHACLLNESSDAKDFGIEYRRPYYVPDDFTRVPRQSWFGPWEEPVLGFDVNAVLPTGDR